MDTKSSKLILLIDDLPYSLALDIQEEIEEFDEINEELVSKEVL